MKTGDKFTIEGVGYSAKGHVVVNGRSVHTQCTIKTGRPLVYEVKEVVSAPPPNGVYWWGFDKVSKD